MINFAKAVRIIALTPLVFMAYALLLLFGVTVVSSLLLSIV